MQIVGQDVSNTIHHKVIRKRSKISAADVALLTRWATRTEMSVSERAMIDKRLGWIDRHAQFTSQGRRYFQDLLARLALKTRRPITLPVNELPFWHRADNSLNGYQSSSKLPEQADVVIIGAGLTGASTAYHLRRSDLKVVVLDRGAPACEASGRNGGNFELFPENSVGIYRGLAPGRLAYMKKCYPHIRKEVLQAISERQASLVLGLALRNRSLLRQTILDEDIACDFSPRGWLHIAADGNEEQSLCDEVLLAAEQGQTIEIWSRKKIKDEFGIEASFLGRFIPGDGTYHPLKFVCGELRRAIDCGVALYTNTEVKKLNLDEKRPQVVTDRGSIRATTVIVATNAFTKDLLPDLAAIEPYQSQIMVTENVADRVRGRIVTSDTGPVFFNQPRDGAVFPHAPLLMGGGDDRPMKNPHSRRRSPKVHNQLMEIRDSFYPELAGQPPSAEWIGPMAFTPDGLPCIGFYQPSVVVAAGYNGYGGTYATVAGFAAAQMALTGQAPDWVPPDIFSPIRLTRTEPLFLSDKNGLWRVAVSLCRQLSTVNKRISEAITIQGIAPLSIGKRRQVVASPLGSSSSTEGVHPDQLRNTRLFASFSLDELKQLLAVMRRWDLPANSIVCTEGSPGGTCFVILSGQVDISIQSADHQQLMATLQAGALFGQVSVIEDVPRMATCTTRTDAVLLEMDRHHCENILRTDTDMAAKFLAVLHDGLIDALHNSDLRLMKLERQSLAPGM
jgi:glycine/D-amino acid oxidase-like deaminating enzyme